MGKNFLTVTNLKAKPHLAEKTLHLIERSFEYPAHNRFQTDFAPLMHESNHHNCFILIDENENVVAHLGVRERDLMMNKRSHRICLLGGIAVDEKFRGEGHFNTLMLDVLSEKRDECAFFVLWSDQEKLYKKYGFHLSGSQFEYSQVKGNSFFTLTMYASLTVSQQQQIQQLYNSSFRQMYLSPERSAHDWKIIELITSADLYISKQDDNIVSYFFLNKGQDLGGIIYEYGTNSLPAIELAEWRKAGRVWTGKAFTEADQEQYQFMLLPADAKLFSALVQDLTNSQIMVRDVNHIKNVVYFDFGDETLELEIAEFLRGILGPGPFEELGDIPTLFFSGLDSI